MQNDPEVTIRPIGDHEPLKLRDAARLMFPDGSVGERALRRQRDAGTLDCSRIGGNDYTTLAAMRTMLERTRVRPKVRQHVEVQRPETATDEPGIALAAALAISRERIIPGRPRGKQASQPPKPPPKPKTRKRQLSPRVPKAPASEP